MTKITTLVHEIYIKAAPEAIWGAITKPEWTARYGYQGRVEYELRPGGTFRTFATPQMAALGVPSVVIDGEVLECNPPHELVQTYRFLFSAEMKAEGFTHLTWEIAQAAQGFARLTVSHGVEGAPIMAGMVTSKFSELGTGGWSWILSDLKSLLETGATLGA
jgi:uncharacterized protein YndB with AHSA1/START domain